MGKTYLKVIGIIFIILGIAAGIIAVMGLAGSGLLLFASVKDGAGAAEIGSTILVVGMVLYLIWALMELIAGYMGVKYCDKPEMADKVFKCGVALIVVSLLANISSMIGAGFSISGLFSLVIGIFLPVLFCYGARLNQKKN